MPLETTIDAKKQGQRVFASDLLEVCRINFGGKIRTYQFCIVTSMTNTLLYTHGAGGQNCLADYSPCTPPP